MRPNTLGCPMDYAQSLRQSDPKLAYWLALAQNARTIMGLYTVEFTFTDGTPKVPQEATFPHTLGEDFFVVDIRSTVERPLAFAGNIFKPQSDSFNSQIPYIDVQLEVVGGRSGSRYLINDSFAPLQMVAPPASAPNGSLLAGANCVLSYTQTVKALFFLTRALSGAELPTRVAISFYGWSLGCRGLDGIETSRAVAELEKLLPPTGLTPSAGPRITDPSAGGRLGHGARSRSPPPGALPVEQAVRGRHDGLRPRSRRLRFVALRGGHEQHRAVCAAVRPHQR